ncbi:hypothetical protein [Croceicoccus gelatinilyticus]|uniref:hypothetical protein n=1 Tax=Croceicoccus gelatinilyticus TaxID=2835536 RepID=UPI001BCFE858|nr:hypothetical protein [Croceicoccus gelatinilyticus]MBS7671528.1 hypothetical protein [Croceicoccus gelatinilyticus]
MYPRIQPDDLTPFSAEVLIERMQSPDPKVRLPCERIFDDLLSFSYLDIADLWADKAAREILWDWVEEPEGAIHQGMKKIRDNLIDDGIDRPWASSDLIDVAYEFEDYNVLENFKILAENSLLSLFARVFQVKPDYLSGYPIFSKKIEIESIRYLHLLMKRSADLFHQEGEGLNPIDEDDVTLELKEEVEGQAQLLRDSLTYNVEAVELDESVYHGSTVNPETVTLDNIHQILIDHANSKYNLPVGARLRFERGKLHYDWQGGKYHTSVDTLEANYQIEKLRQQIEHYAWLTALTWGRAQELHENGFTDFKQAPEWAAAGTEATVELLSLALPDSRHAQMAPPVLQVGNYDYDGLLKYTFDRERGVEIVQSPATKYIGALELKANWPHKSDPDFTSNWETQTNLDAPVRASCPVTKLVRLAEPPAGIEPDPVKAWLEAVKRIPANSEFDPLTAIDKEKVAKKRATEAEARRVDLQSRDLEPPSIFE